MLVLVIFFSRTVVTELELLHQASVSIFMCGRYMDVYAHMNSEAGTLTCMCRGQRSWLTSPALHLNFLTQGLSLKVDFANPARLGGWANRRTLLVPPASVIIDTHQHSPDLFCFCFWGVFSVVCWGWGWPGLALHWLCSQEDLTSGPLPHYSHATRQ